jgi:hypothetical protein
MRPNNSPLEHLAAFAIAFAAGILSAVSLAAYIARMQRYANRYQYKQAEPKAQSPFHSRTSRSTIK